MMFRFSVLALCAVSVAALGLTCAAPPAKAGILITYPTATAASSSTDVLHVSGTYKTPLAGSAPFAASVFGLTLDLPAQASYSPSTSIRIAGFSLNGLSGSYTDAGQTETFTNASAQFGNGSYGSGVYLTLSNLLQLGDHFTMQLNTTDPLFTQTAKFVVPVSYLASFTTGPVTVTGGIADYTPVFAADPSNTINAGGSGQITANGQPVPEPGSLALLFTGLVGLVAVRSLRRNPRKNPVCGL